MILLLSITSYQHVLADTMRSVAVFLSGALSYYTHLISPTMADSSAAIIVSFVIFFSCLPLIKGLIDTLREITVLRRRQTITKQSPKETIEICI
jgi:Co/Zn/Cd efflux system component